MFGGWDVGLWENHAYNLLPQILWKNWIEENEEYFSNVNNKVKCTDRNVLISIEYPRAKFSNAWYEYHQRYANDI